VDGPHDEGPAVGSKPGAHLVGRRDAVGREDHRQSRQPAGRRPAVDPHPRHVDVDPAARAGQLAAGHVAGDGDQLVRREGRAEIDLEAPGRRVEALDELTVEPDLHRYRRSADRQLDRLRTGH
jgi:hypothetical protein